ncbi:MAG: TQO small subunit DoxD [Ktedonobacterales bacterium]
MPQQGSPPTTPASKRAAPRTPSPRQALQPAPASATSTPTFAERLSGEWERLRAAQLSAWMLLPLRLFLGATFVYAGIQKLTDPQYFKPSAVGYIGRQITSFAATSPLRSFLLTVAAPHAMLFGALVAYGELAIGLGVLVGLLLRPAAFFGALLSLLFFLTASWRVYPYFYGSDIVFLFAWTPIILAGPISGGFFALDTRWVPWLLARLTPAQQARLIPALSLLVGIPTADELAGETPRAGTQHGGQTARAGNRRYASYANTQTRREFVWGVVAGGLGALGIAWVYSQIVGAGGATSGGVSTAPAGSGGAGGGAGGSSGGATGSGSVIAKTADVAVNNSASFTIPNGDPGVLVHLKSGSFVAFDATCTHAGCPVSYDPGSQLLLCPCHGAAFDPAHSASVVQGPADTPLTNVAINVDSATGAITLAQ